MGHSPKTKVEGLLQPHAGRGSRENSPSQAVASGLRPWAASSFSGEHPPQACQTRNSSHKRTTPRGIPAPSINVTWGVTLCHFCPLFQAALRRSSEALGP